MTQAGTVGRLLIVLLGWVTVAAQVAPCLGVEQKQVRDLTVWHRAGQTFLVWREVDPPPIEEPVSVQELRKLKSRLDQQGKIRYRIYRSTQPIHSLDNLQPLAEIGQLSAWNLDFYGIYPKPNDMAFRYVAKDGQEPLEADQAIYVHNPQQPGKAYYAVTVVIDGVENRSLSSQNCLRTPVEETVGPGEPVLQRVERPERFLYVDKPTLHFFMRWEAPPRASVENKPFDYLLAVPPRRVEPAPVGIHLHCWGGSLRGGYGWWYNAEKGALLLSTNQIPYDWWTGYHERFWTNKPLRTKEDWLSGRVYPYTQTRIFAFLDWLAQHYKIDKTRTFVAGNSMGGSGSLMLAIRYPERIAWAVSWVGVHVPELSPQFRSSYARVWGPPEYGVLFADGTPVWDYYNDVWFLRQHPELEIGFLTFSNGKNDHGIGWRQAVEFYRALQETHRPHIFVWGQAGHGQRARMPVTLAERVLPIDITTVTTLPAFTRCSLDDNPGNGDPDDGDPAGAINLYLAWKPETAKDTPQQWQMEVYLIDKAPAQVCTVDITPRRCQNFKPRPKETLRWFNYDARNGELIQSGSVQADRWGLVTLPAVEVRKGGNRVVIERPKQ